MKANKILALLLLLILVLTALPARELSIEDALDLAMSSSLQMQNARLELDSLKRQSEDAWGTFLPSMTAAAIIKQANRLNSDSPVPDPSLIFSFNFSFTFNPAMATGIKATKQSYQNGLLSYEEARAKLRVNIEKLYYAIVLQEESLKIKRDTLQVQKERMEQAQTDYDNGYVPELYVLQTQVSYQNAMPEIEQAELSLAQNKRSFAFLIGLDINEEIVLTDRIDQKMVTLNEEELLSSLAMRYDLGAITNAGKLLDLQKKALQQQTYLPSIKLDASHVPTLQAIDGDNWVTTNNYTDNGSVSLTIAYDLTGLFPTSSNQQNIKKLKESKKQLDIQYAMAEESARMEVLTLIDKIRTNREQIENFERTVSLAESSYEMTKKSYENGTSDYLDLKDAENSLNQARLGRLSSEYDYLTALIDLEYATQQTIR